MNLETIRLFDAIATAAVMTHALALEQQLAELDTLLRSSPRGLGNRYVLLERRALRDALRRRT